MGRREIARILKRNRGSKAEVARRAGVGLSAVSMWLKYGANANVQREAEGLALELEKAAQISVRTLVTGMRLAATKARRK